jgi:hypothetical protein
MSKLCKHSRFQYWHHFVYTTLLITHYSLLVRYTIAVALFRPPCIKLITYLEWP